MKTPLSAYQAQPQNHPLYRGMLGWWLYLPDPIGPGMVTDLLWRNHGRQVNSPQYVPNTRPGGLAPAPSYVPASSQYTDIGGASALLTGLSTATIAFSCIRTPGAFSIVRQGTFGSYNSFGVFWFNDNRIYCYAQNLVGNNVVWRSDAITSSGPQNLIFTYDKDAATKVVLYVNGVSVTISNLGAGGYSTIAAPTGHNLAIGRSETSYATGLHDDTCIWNRALTASEALLWSQSSLQGHPRIFVRRRVFALSAGGIETASVSPVDLSVTVPTVTATYAAVLSASVAPVDLNLTVPSVTATHVAVYTASVAPVDLALTIPTVTATSGATATASVAPVDLTMTVPSVSATYTSVLSATVAPVDLTITVPSVSATALVPVTASVSPIDLTITVPTVTANVGILEGDGRVVSSGRSQLRDIVSSGKAYL